MEVITMKNKILTLPIRINQDVHKQISGGTVEVSPINQFQEDMENLLDIADAILQDDLIADSDADGAAADNWRCYRKIVRMIFAANATGWELRQIKYRKAPNMIENVATVVVTIRKDRSFTNEGRTALAMATMLADKITTATDDGDAQISFSVYDIL